MADQDRLLGQVADDSLQMREDVALPGPRQLRPRRGAQLRRRPIVVRPVGSDHGEASRFVAGLETFPALRVEPGAVDQHDGVGHRSSFRWRAPCPALTSLAMLHPGAAAAHSTFGQPTYTLV